MTQATLLTGDALTVLRTMPDQSVRCCITSPPYWGLRDYGQAGQLGLERTPEEYVARMVEVFREVRRVLTDDGTLWLNIGDSYCSTAPGTMGDGLRQSGILAGVSDRRAAAAKKYRAATPNGMKPKDLVGIPWSVAFALRQDGWYLRSEIIWAKPNPMPESVTDRPTKSHEQIFLMSKRASYYWDAEAIKEDATCKPRPETSRNDGGQRGEAMRAAGLGNGHKGGGLGFNRPELGRNTRTVWEIATQPYAGAHFATFPVELARRCILAGTSQRGQCPECGKPWVRVVERPAPSLEARKGPKGREYGTSDVDRRASFHVAGWREAEPDVAVTVGWAPTCDHGLEPIPDVVLDPFSGSGTTAAVAVGHGRNAIGIELNPKYQELARQRIGPLLVSGAA